MKFAHVYTANYVSNFKVLNTTDCQDKLKDSMDVAGPEVCDMKVFG